MERGKQYITAALQGKKGKIGVQDIGFFAQNAAIWAHLPTLSAPIFCVSDTASEAAYGAMFKTHLPANMRKGALILPEQSIATLTNAHSIAHAAQASQATMLVAIGSGSINDMVKYAAHSLQIPYLVIGTAPSMNGYLSANASLMDADGHKASQPASPPLAAYFPLEVLCNAPMRLILSGLADSFSYLSTQHDTLLSHHLLGTPDYAEYFALSQAYGDYFLQNGEILLQHDTQAIETLTEWLLIGGMAMTLAGNSAPASGSEHLIAHQLDDGRYYHGEMVAPATLLALQHQAHVMQPHREAQWASIPADFTKAAATQQPPQPARIMPTPFDASELETFFCKMGIAPHYPQMGYSTQSIAHAITQAPHSRDRLTFWDIQLSHS